MNWKEIQYVKKHVPAHLIDCYNYLSVIRCCTSCWQQLGKFRVEISDCVESHLAANYSTEKRPNALPLWQQLYSLTDSLQGLQLIFNKYPIQIFDIVLRFHSVNISKTYQYLKIEFYCQFLGQTLFCPLCRVTDFGLLGIIGSSYDSLYLRHCVDTEKLLLFKRILIAQIQCVFTANYDFLVL